MWYNTRIIEYDNRYHITFYKRPIQKVELSEELQKDLDDFEKEAIISDLGDPMPDLDPDRQARNLQVSLNRSKNNLFYIANSNKWELFITITFDRNITDSSDYNVVSKKITTFLNNLRKRGSPDLKYLIVPELHKDGKHYHFHGLLSGADSLILKDSGHVDTFGEKIYNIVNWKIGFTTCQKIKDQDRVRNYIGKYITKDLMNRLKYKKRYFVSKNVNLAKVNLVNMTLDELYEKFGNNVLYSKSINIGGIQAVNYYEISKS